MGDPFQARDGTWHETIDDLDRYHEKLDAEQAAEDDFPRGVPKPRPDDIVQVVMSEEMARRFEERCLGHNTVGFTRLSGPLHFRENDLATYIIGVDL